MKGPFPGIPFRKKGSSFGRECEEIASSYLEENRFRIIETNFRTRYGEIDIVAEKDGYIVFVEVKARRSISYGLPQEAVTIRKQEVMRRVAQAFLQKRGLQDRMVRFDVVAISFSADGAPDIEHIPFAF